MSRSCGWGGGGGGLLVFKGNGDKISRRWQSLKLGPKKIDSLDLLWQPKCYDLSFPLPPSPTQVIKIWLIPKVKHLNQHHLFHNKWNVGYYSSFPDLFRFIIIQFTLDTFIIQFVCSCLLCPKRSSWFLISYKGEYEEALRVMRVAVVSPRFWSNPMFFRGICWGQQSTKGDRKCIKRWKKNITVL